MGWLSRLLGRGQEWHWHAARPSGVALAVGGHGLLLGVRAPARIAHQERQSLRFEVEHGAATSWAELTVATSPAGGAPVDEPAPEGCSTIRFGDAGPSISFGGHEPGMDSIFVSIDTGGPPSEWMLIGQGFFLGFPPGFVVLASVPADEALFELHAAGRRPEEGHMIALRLAEFAPSKVQIKTPDAWQILKEGRVDTQAGRARWIEHTYEHSGIRWRSRRYVLPVANDASLLMNAQAPEESADAIFTGSDLAAAGFAPVG